ncbi:class I SAM-dependent methyltransferase [Nocardia thailandica]|uniref:Class I SAM-dependent methyltransferase n=1 Tax=Nocardia thailandica TaxID=257275 RepID=A0ABW6PIG0_9NOCA
MSNRVMSPMFVDDAGTGLVIADIRRYNVFTSLFFLGRHGRLLRELATASGARPGDTAADIGCGPGKLVRALGAVVGPTGSVVGVDPSAAAVAADRAADPRHRYAQAPAQSLPFGDAEFDVLTCTFVMHHIPAEHRDAALAEMWRVLRPGGRVLLADVAPGPAYRAVLNLVTRHGDVDPFADADIRRYTGRLRELGFTDIAYTRSRYQTGILTAVRPR